MLFFIIGLFLLWTIFLIACIYGVIYHYEMYKLALIHQLKLLKERVGDIPEDSKTVYWVELSKLRQEQIEIIQRTVLNMGVETPVWFNNLIRKIWEEDE